MCIFCQIVSGELPSRKVYEDDKILVILDIQPVNFGDTLVILKEHYENMEAVPVEDLMAFILIVKKIGLLLKEKLGVVDYNIIENNGPAAGQMIPHFHFHLIPRLEGDDAKFWPTREYAAGEADGILKKLTS